METIVYVLMVFITLNCLFKLSFWRWWQRAIYSGVLALFVLWSEQYAVLQSKTQLSDYLQDSYAIGNIAIIVTLESIFCFAFVAMWMNGSYGSGLRKWASSILFYYPSLLLFPVSFYVLTQLIFSLTGVSFTLTTVIVAVVFFFLLPVLAEVVRRLLIEDDFRVEIHLLLSCVVCVLGLISTQNGQLIYAAHDMSIDLPLLAYELLVGIVLVVVGIGVSRIRWRFYKRKKQ